jgi:EpsI family protein
MTVARLRAAIFLSLVVAAAAAAHFWRPTHYLADTRAKVDLEQFFPQRIGAWTVDNRGPVQLISPDQKALLNKLYNQTLSRTYVNDKGMRTMLSVAYGGDQSDATSAHQPEVCYPAQGFQVLSKNDATVQISGEPMRVRHLVAQLNDRIEPITYWIMVGERQTLSGTEQKLAQLSYSTRGIVPDGMLIRVSSLNANATAAFALHQAFMADLATTLRPEVRARVMGPSNL